MKKTDMLFIRTCKTFYHLPKLKRVFKRVYKYEPDYADLARVLSFICDEHLPMKTHDFMEQCHSKSRYISDPCGYRIPTEVLVSRIANCKVSELPDDMIWSVRWKRKQVA